MNSNNNQNAIRIGSSLSGDSDKIKDLLACEAAGIVVHTSHADGKQLCIYRPTTALNTPQEVVKTIRRFLVLVSVLGGLTLTPVKSPKEIPEQTLDFEKLCQALRAKSLLNAHTDD